MAAVDIYANILGDEARLVKRDRIMVYGFTPDGRYIVVVYEEIDDHTLISCNCLCSRNLRTNYYQENRQGDLPPGNSGRTGTAQAHSGTRPRGVAGH